MTGLFIINYFMVLECLESIISRIPLELLFFSEEYRDKKLKSQLYQDYYVSYLVYHEQEEYQRKENEYWIVEK